MFKYLLALPDAEPPPQQLAAVRMNPRLPPRRLAAVSVRDTWSWREQPLLEIALREIDERGRDQVTFEALAEETGFELRIVSTAMRALEEAGYIEAYYAGAFSGLVVAVTERTRRHLGSWPSPESLVDQLARAFTMAADDEAEPERKSQLRAVAEGLGGAGRTVAVEMFTAWLRQETGLR